MSETTQDIEQTDPVDRAIEVLEGLLKRMDIPADIDIGKDNDRTVLDIKCENEDDVQRIIGRRGQVIDSLQHLVAKAVGRNRDEDYRPVIIDAADYRKRQIERLEGIANKKAAECIEAGSSVELNPMSAHDRRIIHMTLAESEEVRTESEGEGADRHVVILLK